MVVAGDMSESGNKQSRNGAQEEEQDEDYMGDLSRFLPSEAIDSSQSLSTKVINFLQFSKKIWWTQIEPDTKNTNRAMHKAF